MKHVALCGFARSSATWPTRMEQSTRICLCRPRSGTGLSARSKSQFCITDSWATVSSDRKASSGSRISWAPTAPLGANLHGLSTAMGADATRSKALQLLRVLGPSPTLQRLLYSVG